MNLIEKKIQELRPWFHNLRIAGIQTAPEHELGDFPMFKWNEIRSKIPEDLTGWTVLDIGCNAGFYSFELAKRGAIVTSIDIDDHYLEQARWASQYFEKAHNITFVKRQVYEMARIPQKYDMVWFMGVFYHLRYPFLALDIVSRLTKKIMVFQTMMIPGKNEKEIPTDISLNEREVMNSISWPKIAFIENSLEGDPTNWWTPNYSCIKSMMRASGFEVLAEPSHEIFICKRNAERIPVEDIREQEYRAAIGMT